MQYLRMNDPVTYAKMAKVQIQRKALESRLKQAKSKEEALEIYTSAKSRISDDDPAREELNAAYDDAYGEFKNQSSIKTACNRKRGKGERKMAQVGAVGTKTSQETQNSQKTKKKHTNSEFLEILRERNEELKEKSSMVKQKNRLQSEQVRIRNQNGASF